MLLLVVVALIGAVASEPQGIIPMGYNIVAPNVAPSMFPVPYSTIPAASIPSSIPAVMPDSMQSSIPTLIPGSLPSSIPTLIPASMPSSIPTLIPASMPSSIPTLIPASLSSSIPSVIPAAMPSSIPAVFPAPIPSTMPAESIPAATIPLGSFPASTGPLGSFPAAPAPVGSIPAATIPVGSVPAATIPAAPGVIQMGPNIVYPSLDINMVRSSLIPRPVEDTPEVKKARMDFEMAYNKAQSETSESGSVFRAKRDIQRVLPYGYNLPYSGYVTPYGHISGSIPSSHVLPSNVLHAPYFSHV